MHNQNSSKLWLNQTYSIKHLFTDATSVPVICLFILPPLFWLIAAITQLCRKEAQTTDKSLEDVLGNLNLSSTITPQMINLGLSQERKLLSVFDERDIKQALCFHAAYDSAFYTVYLWLIWCFHSCRWSVAPAGSVQTVAVNRAPPVGELVRG